MVRDNKDVYGSFNVKSELKEADWELLSLLFNETESVTEDAPRDLPANFIKETIELLNEFPAAGPINGAGQHFALRSVGKPPQKQNGADTDGKAQNKMTAAAETLLSKDETLSVKMSRLDDELRFLIEAEPKTADCLGNRLQGFLGQAQLEAYWKQAKKFPCRSYALCQKTGPEEKEPQAVKAAETDSNWPSALANANFNEDFCVTVRFVPVTEQKISEWMDKLEYCYATAVEYQDVNVQVSAGDSISNSDKENIVKELGKTIIGVGISSSTNHSLSLSKTKKNAELEKVIQLLQVQLHDLVAALSIGGWNIFINCEAKTMETLSALQSILSASFVNNGIHSDWREDTDRWEQKSKPAIFVTQKDAHLFLQIPSEDFEGFEAKENDELSVNPPNAAGGFVLGKTLKNDLPLRGEFRMNSDALNRHAFVCGMTGSGKSNTLFHILGQAPAPFLVIEPVKGEYKTLKSIFPDLKSHAMNPIEKTAMRINPFWFPKGGSLSFHIDALKTIISSAFSLYAAMPNILEQCIYLSYAKRGWNIVSGKNIYTGIVSEEFIFPTISDLCQEIELYLERSAFTGEALGNYQGALLSRLQSFTTGAKGVLLNTTNHPDYSEWLANPTVVELDALADDSDKCLVMGVILMQYFQYLKVNTKPVNGLRHLTVIEEAHRLFKNVGQTQKNSETADPQGQLVETLSNMMAEIRAYGEGIIIVDQSPTKIAEDVIKNSSIKIVHRLDNKKDIEAIESSLLLKDAAVLISSLSQGKALVRSEQMSKPVKVLVEKSSVKDTELDLSAEIETASDTNDIANADFVLMNESFKEDLVLICRKYINHILFDDYHQIANALSKICLELKEYMHFAGYSSVMSHSGRGFYLRLISNGIRAAMYSEQKYSEQAIMQILMLSGKLCDIAIDNRLTDAEIRAFSAYRREQIYPLLTDRIINAPNKNKEYAILMKVCGYQTIYADILLEIMNYVNKKESVPDEQEVSWAWANEQIKQYIPSMFLVAPASYVVDNLTKLTQFLFEILSKAESERDRMHFY